MGRSIGVLATRYLWAGIVEDVKLGDVKVYPDPALPQVDLRLCRVGKDFHVANLGAVYNSRPEISRGQHSNAAPHGAPS